MADGLSYRIITEPAISGLHKVQRNADLATKQALRAVGRKVKQESRKRAPVYKGPERTVSYGDGNRGPIERGELKRSIGSSKRFKVHGPGDYSIVVGPRGGHVHLYAAKQERRSPFMAPAFQIASSEARAIHSKTWEKAIHR